METTFILPLDRGKITYTSLFLDPTFRIIVVAAPQLKTSYPFN